MSFKYNADGELIIDAQATIVGIDSGVVLPVSLSQDYLVAVARGDISGVSNIRKFGINPDIDSIGQETIWDVGGTHPSGTSDQSFEVVSDSASDTLTTGSGAWTVTVEALNAAGSIVTQTVNMNGTSAVALGTQFALPYRAFVATVGSNETNVGNIDIQIASGGADHARIRAGKGQTLMCVYRVPAGKKGYIYQWAGRVLGNTTADVNLELIHRPSGGAWRIQEQIAVRANGSSSFADRVFAIQEYDAGTDIVIEGTSSANNTIVGASFDLLLVDD